MPVIVPPVPTPATKWVTWPSVSRPDLRAGGLVVADAGPSGLEYWLGFQRAGDLPRPAGRRRGSRSPGARAATAVGQTTTSAPYAVQHVALVLADLVRADEHAVVAALLGDQGQADAGVAGGRLDDGAAGLQLAARASAASIIAQRDAVLRPSRRG